MKRIKHFNIGMSAFGMCTFLMWAYMTWFISWYDIPEPNREMFIQTQSTVKELMFMIGMFLFGSTVGSRMNAETIAIIAKGKPNDEAQNIQ